MLIPLEPLVAKYRIKPTGILHIGASVGQEAKEYHRLGFRPVIWVEAIPAVFQELSKNISKYPDNIALHACVGNEDGKEVTFHIASNEGQSSSMLELGTHAQEHPEVRYVDHIKTETVRVDTLLCGVYGAHGISVGDDWFLNIDLQGAELMALQGMGDLLKQFKYAYIEVNERELYQGCPLIGDIDKYLNEFGFRRLETKMTGFGWGDAFLIRE